MNEYESVQAGPNNDETLHYEVANDGTTTTETGYHPESVTDLEEDGFDIATHGGGRLESVAGFSSNLALTEGFPTAEVSDYSELLDLVSADVYEYSQPETVCGRDDRVRISPATSIPWRMICQLIVTLPNGAKVKGTGWFIGPRTVMTAGHCVYSHAHGGWAKAIEVIPGMDGNSKPYGSQVGTTFRSVTGWTNERKATHDYGCILLPDKTLGQRVGWFGFAALTDSSLKNLLVNNSGYAGDKPTGTQWFNAGRITDVKEYQLRYLIDTYGGHSGSPVWRYRENKRHAVGIHAYGGCPNAATRITRAVFDNMKNWKNA